jgi:MFS family permease
MSSSYVTPGHDAAMRRVLAQRDFRLLWLSQVGSTIGDRLTLIALALYVNRIGTPSDVGLVLAAQSIPFVALLLIGGVWADRLPRHRVMVVTDLARAVLHGVLAVLILAGSVEIWQIVVIEALFGRPQGPRCSWRWARARRWRSTRARSWPRPRCWRSCGRASAGSGRRGRRCSASWRWAGARFARALGSG